MKKKILLLTTAICTFALALCLAGCSSNTNPIVGTWKYTGCYSNTSHYSTSSSDFKESLANSTLTLIVESDGTFYSKIGEEIGAYGTWEKTDNGKYNLKYNDSNTKFDNMTVDDQGKTLHWQRMTGGKYATDEYIKQ